MAGWGLAFAPSAWLVERMPPLTVAGARLALAGLLLLMVLRLCGRPLGPRVSLVAVAWVALTQTVAFYAATYWGIAEAGAGLAAVLANTDPLFTAALAALVLGERLSGRQWAGLGVGFMGAAVVAWKGDWPPAPSLPALVVVGGALAWGLGTVAAMPALRGRARPLALAGWQMAVGGGALLVWGLLSAPAPAVGAGEAVLLVALAALGSAAPLALFYLALTLAPAAQVSAWFFLVPVVAVVTAWPLLGEEPGPRLVVGLLGVCAGLWLVLARPAADRAGGRGAGGVVHSPPPP
jgi:drug/metabolite transporter (DMT)-like permease